MTMPGKQYGSAGKTSGICPGSDMPVTKKHNGNAVKILKLLWKLNQDYSGEIIKKILINILE